MTYHVLVLEYVSLNLNKLALNEMQEDISNLKSKH